MKDATEKYFQILKFFFFLILFDLKIRKEAGPFLL